jgi:hypothetical protein
MRMSDSVALAQVESSLISPREIIPTVQVVDAEIENVVRDYEALISDFYEGFQTASCEEEVDVAILELTEIIPDLKRIKEEFRILEEVRKKARDPDGYLEAD